MCAVLKNKIIIVTGGSGLIGQCIVRNVIEKGGKAINLDCLEPTDYKETWVNCDVTSHSKIKSTFLELSRRYGKVDGLVNNAYPRTKDWSESFEEVDPESIITNVKNQLCSTIIACREIINIMKPKGHGSIVNLASIYGVVGNDFSIYEGTEMEPPAAYTGIKGGVINFTRYLASRYSKFGIRSNCVSPGGIFNGQPKEFVAAYEKRVPMKRMGTPSDIAPVVSFLLSDEAQYITGHNLVVDGGWTAI